MHCLKLFFYSFFYFLVIFYLFFIKSRRLHFQKCFLRLKRAQFGPLFKRVRKEQKLASNLPSKTFIGAQKAWKGLLGFIMAYRSSKWLTGDSKVLAGAQKSSLWTTAQKSSKGITSGSNLPSKAFIGDQKRS